LHIGHWSILIEIRVVAVATTTAAATAATSSCTGAIELVTLGTRLGELDINLSQHIRKSESNAREVKPYQFPVNLQVPETKERGDISVLKRDEPKAFAATSLAIEHDRRIDNFTKLREKFAHRLRSYTASEAADEEFCSALMLLTRNSSLWVDLLQSG